MSQLFTPLITGSGSPVAVTDTAMPVICWDNLLENGDIEVTSEQLGFEGSFAIDWKTGTWWKPDSLASSPQETEQFLTLTLAEPAEASYFAYFSHDLAVKGASIQLQYLDENQSPAAWEDATAEEIPATDRPRVILFEPITAAQWRVRLVLSEPSDPVLGVVAFGPHMELERGMRVGFTPPGYGNSNTYVPSFSESGEFIGRSLIRRGEERTITLAKLTPTWVRTVWQPFAAHAETKPFFFAWCLEDHPVEVAFCVPIEDPRASYDHELYMAASIKCRCLVGETTSVDEAEQV